MPWWLTVTAMSALTLWILSRGYQVATGQSRQSAMELVVTALRASLTVGVAMGMVSAAKPNGDESSLYWRVTDGLSSAIVKTVTGSSDSPYKEIDKNLALMQVGMTIIDQPAMALDQAPAVGGSGDRASEAGPSAGPLRAQRHPGRCAERHWRGCRLQPALVDALDCVFVRLAPSHRAAAGGGRQANAACCLEVLNAIFQGRRITGIRPKHGIAYGSALAAAQCRSRDSGTCGCGVADAANSQSRQMGYHLLILQMRNYGWPAATPAERAT
ncbi:hypothetical protein XTALMG727_0765 [Xanthomonas translucens pv. arrhenatheri LMG 727]|uniref:Uncharacterized protein n=1 Tax=Xanthomonas graminis pv. arrhenatheri LMG 727 TaxID=1195923 RepID=A0A0K2ZHV9_9XANT|nr:hypothetical protein XTALMG727_0765 [Xanthomonas translucens pv. arrhenatheri LMG 727]